MPAMSHTVAAGTSNFLIPNATFIVEFVSFLIVLAVLWRYVVPPVQKAMEARQEMARKLLEDSEAAKQSLANAQAAYQEALTDARREAAQLRASAEEQRKAIVERAAAEAEAKVAEVLARGQAQLEAEQRQAIRELKSELGAVAVELAEKVLGEALGDSQRQQRLLDRFLTDLEAEGAGAAR